jgi:uncharacterized protein YcbK (DUF882 family)
MTIVDEAPPTPLMTQPAAAPSDPVPPTSAPAEPAEPARRALTMFELAKLEEARRQAAQVDLRVRESATVVRARQLSSRLITAGGVFVACSVAIALSAPLRTYFRGAQPYQRIIEEGAEVVADAPAIPGEGGGIALGRSGGVNMRVAMPAQLIEFPLSHLGDQTRFRYQWVRAADSSVAEDSRPLNGNAVITPMRPGLYQLALTANDPRVPAGMESRRVYSDVTVAVLVPFREKFGGMINGYRIGNYPFERLGGERPLGFVEVDERSAHLKISRHLQLADFITRDEQTQWPKYVAVSPRLLDKLELVVNEVARMSLRGIDDPMRVSVDVHSGFRTPLHNSGVEGAALNSRHQYGDAADVAIDADGDGRFTSFDGRLVGMAVEMVEKRNPELVGGMGLYLNTPSPYVHVDARGRRARWWR